MRTYFYLPLGGGIFAKSSRAARVAMKKATYQDQVTGKWKYFNVKGCQRLGMKAMRRNGSIVDPNVANRNRSRYHPQYNYGTSTH